MEGRELASPDPGCRPVKLPSGFCNIRGISLLAKQPSALFVVLMETPLAFAPQYRFYLKFLGIFL